MIEKCITSETNPIVINVDKPIDLDNVRECERIAAMISEETGVPKGFIYSPVRPLVDRWHKIGDEWYFYKSDDYDFHFINELLGEIISEYFGVDTVHYSVAKLCVSGKEQYGLLSKNFCDKKYTYKTVWDYGLTRRSNLSILGDIRGICGSDSEYLLLLKDLKKFFIRDFYTSQLDRTGANFMFRVGSEGIRLAPLYDYENSFESISPEWYRNQIVDLRLKDEETRAILRSDDDFQELLHSLMRISMKDFLQIVKSLHKIRISSDLRDYYEKWDKDIKRLVKEYEVIK